MSINSPPQFLLDALKDSITSGSFVDTKFYIFSRRNASGRVGAPRPVYCNSRVLVFSDGFLEGQMRDINEGFPSDSDPYTEYYEYSSDSDLEDEYSCSGKDGDDEKLHNPQDSDPQTSPIVTSETSQPEPSGEISADYNHHWGNGSVRMGKVAIIRDMAAVTFESMVYFLYTGNITFAPFTSDPHHELPAEERAGDWSTAKIPSSSPKSIYRLADKYDIPTLKEQAKAHILDTLAHCNIVDEVFSGFSLSFPEILSVQVARLVNSMKEESTKGAESGTRRQLREKIAALSQSQLARATDALAMIWDGVTGLFDLNLPSPEPSKPVPCTKLTPPLIWHWVIYPLSSNWNRVKLALLKSVLTGTFIDVQFYAYNSIREDLPTDLKPLYASSIVIGEWEPAIMTQTVGVDSRGGHLMDGLADDYEYWNVELPKRLPKDKLVLKHQTEAAILISGAWKTWMSLFSYIYTNEMSFGPLQPSIQNRDPVADSEAQISWYQSCSARSMYSLAAALGIENIKEDALKDIKSKLCAANIAQELFTTFAANHEEVMGMEIEFYKNSTERDSKSLMNHITRTTSSSSEAPFTPTSLSLVYDKLVERVFTQPTASDSSLGKPSTTECARSHEPCTPTVIQQPDPTPVAAPSIPTQQSPNPSTVPVPELESEAVPLGAIWLECFQCSQRARLRDLFNGLRCPRCPSRPRGKGRPFMQCPACKLVRGTPKEYCVRAACQARFV